MRVEDVVAFFFGVVIFLFGLALTIYYWQLMVPFWILVMVAGVLEGKRFRGTIAWAVFLLCAWFLFHTFPPEQKTAAETFCSWRDCPDAPDDRGANGSCGKFCGE